MWFSSLLRPAPHKTAAHALYGTIVKQARAPIFFRDWSVPDTIDGRFDMLSLHAILVMRRLGEGGHGANKVSQALFDLMFGDLDDTLREMGVGDMAVPKRIQAMSEAFFGRAKAYGQALDAHGSQALTEALARNVYRGIATAHVEALQQYVRMTAGELAKQAIEDLSAGRVRFPAPVEVRHP